MVLSQHLHFMNPFHNWVPFIEEEDFFQSYVENKSGRRNGLYFCFNIYFKFVIHFYITNMAVFYVT